MISLSFTGLRVVQEDAITRESCWCDLDYSHYETNISAIYRYTLFSVLRPRQNGRHFPNDIFKCLFLNKNVWISVKISLKFVPDGPINNIPAQVQIMAWRRQGDNTLSEPMMVRLTTHICVTRSQWVKSIGSESCIHPTKCDGYFPLPNGVRWRLWTSIFYV